MSMVSSIVEKLEDVTSRHALLKAIECEKVPELLDELEVSGWYLKSVIPVDMDRVSLLLKRHS